ncbi:hypothetical protein CPB86DRAFT_779496 [Serendipita vermifera]|nr:hypothetical protein CPB86DRAFT_779496 [Serendipita vermifera]
MSEINYESMFQEAWQEHFDHDHIWRIPQQGTYPSTSTQPSVPTPLPSSAPSGSLGAQDTPIPISILQNVRDRLAGCSWLQRNEDEPQVDDRDPLVQMQLIKPGMSRFDPLIWSQGEQHSCLFVQPGTSNRCKYSNYRRQRVRSHIYSHFGYKPFACGGDCGKADCSLSFADSVLLADHVRRIVKPRAECEICGAMIAPQNYKRHLMLVHSIKA